MTRTSTASSTGLPAHVQITDENFLEMYKGMEAESSKQKEEIFRLSARILELESLSAEVEKKAEFTIRMVDDLKKAIDDRDKAIESLKAERVELENRISSLSQDLVERKRLYKGLNDEWAAKLNSEIKAHTAEKRTYEQRLADAANSLKEARVERDNFNVKILELEQKLADQAKRISGLLTDLGLANQGIAGLSRDLDKANDKSASLEKQIADKNSLVEQLQNQIISLKESMVAKEQSTKATLSKHIEEFKSLQDQAKKDRELASASSSVISTKDSLIAEKDVTIGTLKSNLEEAKKSLDSKEGTIKDLEEKLSEHDYYKTQASVLSKQLREKDEIIDDLNNEITLLKESGKISGNFKDWFGGFAKE